MTPAQRYERIPMSFAFREFVYGQPARGMDRSPTPPPFKATPMPRPTQRSWVSTLTPLEEVLC